MTGPSRQSRPRPSGAQFSGLIESKRGLDSGSVGRGEQDGESEANSVSGGLDEGDAYEITARMLRLATSLRRAAEILDQAHNEAGEGRNWEYFSAAFHGAPILRAQSAEIALKALWRIGHNEEQCPGVHRRQRPVDRRLGRRFEKTRFFVPPGTGGRQFPPPQRLSEPPGGAAAPHVGERGRDGHRERAGDRVPAPPRPPPVPDARRFGVERAHRRGVARCPVGIRRRLRIRRQGGGARRKAAGVAARGPPGIRFGFPCGSV